MGLIVMIPDVFGSRFASSRILADQYTKKGGYLVYFPDFMNGQSIDDRKCVLSSFLHTKLPAYQRCWQLFIR